LKRESAAHSFITSKAGGAAAAIAAFAAAIALLVACALCAGPGPDLHTIGSYAVDLSQRTPHQRWNARLAARSIDGHVVKPGAIFSYNRTIKNWTADRGYLRAPVSYDGVLIDSCGGGVCETSTALYNAALLAGLPIVERHPHTFAPSYVPPGRDAAVAFPGVDLRFGNDLAVPIIVRANVQGDQLVVKLEASQDRKSTVGIVSTVLARTSAPPLPPGTDLRKRSPWRLLGHPGVRIAIYRVMAGSTGVTHKEFISDNTYQPIASAIR
jgi:hypothetical protein